MTNTPTKIIVIGTSAGGLQVLFEILSSLRADYPIPIVVVQHRSKVPKDLLEEVMQSRCGLRVKQADEKEAIEPGSIYVAPPDYHLLVDENRTFALTSDEPVEFARPSINVLFETAAETYGRSVLGILLTGANKDGANGLATIRKRGGLTIAQDPAEAAYPVMPESAIAIGAASMVMRAAEINKYLSKLS